MLELVVVVVVVVVGERWGFGKTAVGTCDLGEDDL